MLLKKQFLVCNGCKLRKAALFNCKQTKESGEQQDCIITKLKTITNYKPS